MNDRGAPDNGRRKFLAGLAVGLTSAIGAALAGIGLNTFLCPALVSNEPRWIRVGEVDPDRISGPRGFVVSFRQSDGWFKGSGQGVVYVTRGADEQIKVLASSCTHLGCGVRWDQEKERFLCPCHGGEYDANGAVTAGPPPKPLEALESRFEDGVLYVKGLG